MPIRPIQDPFAAITQSIRQNRQEKRQGQIDAQNAVTRGLQQKGLELGIQGQERQIANQDLIAKNKAEMDSFIGLPENQGKDRDFLALQFLEKRNPEGHKKLFGEILNQADQVKKLAGGKAGIDFMNKKTGSNMKFISDDGDFTTIDLVDRKVRIDNKTNEVVATFDVGVKPATPKETTETTLVKNLKAAGIEEGTPEFTQAILSNLQKGQKNVTTKVNPDGSITISETTGPAKGSIQQQKFSEVQSKSGGFADRVNRSNEITNKLEDDPKFDPTSVGESIAADVPLVGNVLLSPERQRYEQAKRDFISAVLRLESGAAIAPSEFDSANKLYFPQVGDSKEVVAQKRASRNFQFDILKSAGAGSFEQIQEQRGPTTETDTKPLSEMSDEELLEALNAN